MHRQVTAKFIPENLTISYRTTEGRELYYSDIEQATSAAGLLDLIYQLGQPFDPSVVGQFMREMDRICEVIFGQRVQGVFCACGQDRKVRWPRLTPEQFRQREREYNERISSVSFAKIKLA